MRSKLFTIPLDYTFDLGPLGKWPLFRPGVLLALWCLLGAWLLALTVSAYRKGKLGAPPWNAAAGWLVVAIGLFVAPQFTNEIPIYGYGTMLFIGFLVAGTVAAARLRRMGEDPELAWDAAMWVFIAGIIGARMFFVAQYSERFFVRGHTLAQVLKSLIDLPDGGLVFYGGVITGGLAFAAFCRLRKVRVLAFGDVAITSVFIGMAFGRIGCLLNGCCYGDVCSLPWSVTFPPDSVPFVAEVNQGYLSSAALRSLPLHPTQLYSALNSALLALVTFAYYPFRRKDGEVLALGWVIYPICRFTVEFLRGDELGQLGTTLTISQWVSLGLFATGLCFLFYVEKYGSPAVGMKRPLPR